MSKEANVQEGIRCLEKAKIYAAQKNFTVAERLGMKALRMLPVNSTYAQTARQILEQIKQHSEKQDCKGPSTRRRTVIPHDQSPSESHAASSEQGGGVDMQLETKCRAILASRDYYKILNVTKDTSQEDIKKAYRKLALQFHPDKARCPSAEAAFKEISKAYQCLSNAEAKKYYDAHGTEEASSQYRQEHYEAHFMSAEDLFESFFGMQFPRNQFHHTRTYHAPSGNQNFQSFNVLQILPFIVLVIISIFSSFFNSSNHLPFSYTWSPSYNVARTTHNYNLLYYVNSNFLKSYREGSKKLRDLETQIEMNYYSSECSHELEGLLQEIQTLRYYGLSKRYKTKIEELRTRENNSLRCQRYKELKRLYPKLYESLRYTTGHSTSLF